MDDYNISAIYEAKNEYSARLIDIMTPLVIEGIKSIFKEAIELCIVNDEKEKYLMTFQNFLTRVPKWNQSIINVESNRIIKSSGCSYLDDLISCVHISQLKILTSVRVSTKQKKVDIDIPKVNDFIHNIYIKFARKLYSNVYLFETTISPLQIQKNNRECELICKECILNVIRENIPVDKILRAYIDTTEEEEEIAVETVTVNNSKSIEEKSKKSEKSEKPVQIQQLSVKSKSDIASLEEKNPLIIVKKENTKNVDPIIPQKNIIQKKLFENPIVNGISNATKSLFNIETIKETPIQNLTITTLPNSPDISKPITIAQPTKSELENLSLTIIDKPPSSFQPIDSTIKNRISFSNNDEIKEYNIASSPKSSNNAPVNNVTAPKNIQRLEKISAERNQQRKDEEAEEDDDEKIKIFSNDNSTLKLDSLEIETLPSLPKSRPSTPVMKLNTSELNIETLN